MAELVFDLQVKYFFWLYLTPIHSFTQQTLLEYLSGLGSMLRTRHTVVNLSLYLGRSEQGWYPNWKGKEEVVTVIWAKWEDRELSKPTKFLSRNDPNVHKK